MACAPEAREDATVVENELGARSGADVAAKARTLLDTTVGLSVDLALRQAAATGTFTPDEYEVDYVVRRLGPAALPFMLERPWRREGNVASWPLTDGDASNIVHAFAKRGALDVLGNVIDGLIHHPNLTDAYKRRLIVAYRTSRVDATGKLAVDPALSTPISASELADILRTSERAADRSLLALLLEGKHFGFGALSVAERRSTIDALLADRELSVRLAAAPLFWEGSDVSRAAQEKVFAILSDPATLASIRLSSIYSMGWSRERADLWGTPDAAVSEVLDARASLIGTLLEHAAPSADIEFLLGEAASHSNFQGVCAEAARRLMASTCLTVAQKSGWFEKLTLVSDDELEPFVVRFAWEHPDQGPSLPKSMGLLVAYRYEPEFGRVRPQDSAAWTAQVATPAGLKQAFRDAFDARGFLLFADVLTPNDNALVRTVLLRELGKMVSPGQENNLWGIDGYVEKALAAGIPASTLVPIVTSGFHPDGYPSSQAAPLAALVRVARDPSIDAATFKTLAMSAAPWAAGHSNYSYAVWGSTFTDSIAFTADARLTSADRSALLQKIFADASVPGARQAAEVLISLGVTDRQIATLAQARPELLLDVLPGPLELAELTPRAKVLAAHLSTSPLDETQYLAGVDGYYWKPVDAAWADLVAYHQWNTTTRPPPSARSLLATQTAQLTQDTLRQFAGAPDIATLSDAEVSGFFARAGGGDIVEAYAFEADLARGRGYDALRTAHHAKAPLLWEAADRARPSSEVRALEVLVTSPPIASPLWEGALLAGAARSSRLSDDFQRGFISESITVGYLQKTSADTSYDGFDALEGYRGTSIDFVSPRLVRYGERFHQMPSPNDALAFEPIVTDPRLSELVLRDVLLTAVDANLRVEDVGSFDEPTAGLAAVIARALKARPDLSATTRQSILHAADLLMNTHRFQTPARQARIIQAARQWENDRPNAHFVSAGPPAGTAARTVFKHTENNHYLEINVLEPAGPDAAEYWVRDMSLGSTTNWAGPFVLPAITAPQDFAPFSETTGVMSQW